MGADGGSIPRRCEMVRTAKQTENTNRSALIIANWSTCDLSKDPLSFPVVSCRLGRLYSKSSLLQLLISRKQNAEFPFSDDPSKFLHIKSLKDVQELAISGEFLGYLCPITGRPLNGTNRFYFNWGCGCVFSEQALLNPSCSMYICPVCSRSFQNPAQILLNPCPKLMKHSPLHAKAMIDTQTMPSKTNTRPRVSKPPLTNYRNEDYSPLDTTSLSSVVQERVSVAKNISSISSMYLTKP